MSDLLVNRADDERRQREAWGIRPVFAGIAAQWTLYSARESRWTINGGSVRFCRRLADVDGVDGSVVTELNTDVNPFTALIDTEGPLRAGIQNLLELTGIQQDLLDPVLGLVGSLGGLLTS